jgi:hypothetical protein
MFSLVMIGDGATDMEAFPPAVSIYLFIAIHYKKNLTFFNNNSSWGSCGKLLTCHR